MPALRRWTPLLFLAPRRYINKTAGRDIALKDWSASFEWRQDPWNGYQDFAQPVTETIRTRTGDCEDYALVAASSLLATGHCVELVVCFNERFQPRHVVAYDGHRVYSSGEILDRTLDEYIASSNYRTTYRKSIPQ